MNMGLGSIFGATWWLGWNPDPHSCRHKMSLDETEVPSTCRFCLSPRLFGALRLTGISKTGEASKHFEVLRSASKLHQFCRWGFLAFSLIALSCEGRELPSPLRKVSAWPCLLCLIAMLDEKRFASVTTLGSVRSPCQSPTQLRGRVVSLPFPYDTISRVPMLLLRKCYFVLPPGCKLSFRFSRPFGQFEVVCRSLGVHSKWPQNEVTRSS